MLDGEKSAKRYEPEKIDIENPNSCYALELKLIGQNKTVLEVGPATGYITRILKSFGNRVYCVEIDDEAAKEAEKYCDKIVVGDIEELDLDYYFKAEQFDVILFGDVLEHLRWPKKVLEKVKKYLKPDGYIVASIPNISHGDIILSLICGKFEYKSMGLLDETHLRFFTLENIFKMFRESGYKIAEVYSTKVKVGYSEFGDIVKKVPAPIVNFVKKLPYSNVYQFVVKAHHAEYPAEEAEIEEIPVSSIPIDEIVELQRKVLEYEKELRDLKISIEFKEEKIKDLKDRLERLEAELRQKDEENTRLREKISAKDEQIRKLTEDVMRLSSELESIKSSVTWRTVMKWHSLIERIAPLGTRRRRWYDLGIKGLRILVNEGLKSLYQKYKSYKALGKIESYVNNEKIRVDTEQEVEIIDKKVSVIIPTKNASPDFEYTLEKIRNQKGIKQIEIICIDSGSTDNTVEIAEKFGAKVYKIKPEEFNHGETRNHGAEMASGDYLVFTVQDAIPVGEYWLYNMIKVLEEDPDVAAVTCRQIPRNDADLFACWSMWYHYKALDFNRDKIITPPPNFDKLPPIEKRELCGLDDVSTAIRRDIFSKFKFRRTPFAEDLDLGIRLVKSNYKLAFLYSTAVIHSHVRNAYYHLKRSYVDRLALENILEHKSNHYPECSVEELSSSLLILYCSLNKAVERVVSNPAYKHGNELIISKVKDYMQESVREIGNSLNLEEMLECASFEESLKEFFSQLYMLNGARSVNKKITSTFLTAFFSSLESLKECPTTKYAKPEEVISAIYKIFAIHVGNLLAEKLRENIHDEKYENIRKLVEGGV